ncbi:MAG: tetratricopeptide repeat protein [Bilophila wadsworthia]
MQLDEHFQRRLNEARMFFAEGKALAAEKIYRDLLKPDLPAGGRVLVLDGLGRCLHIQGRLEEAETFFRESLRFLEELFGPNHIHVAAENLARLRSERGECEEAATLGERALDILKQNLPADDLSWALLNLPPISTPPKNMTPPKRT